jgi:hypothetical protein
MEETYRFYCEGVDVRGAHEPASFICICMECFAQEAQKYGLDFYCRRDADSPIRRWFSLKSERESLIWTSDHFDGLLVRLTEQWESDP